MNSRRAVVLEQVFLVVSFFGQFRARLLVIVQKVFFFRRGEFLHEMIARL